MEYIGIISIAVLALVAILGLVYSHIKLDKLTKRLARARTKVNQVIPDTLSNPEPFSRRDELLIKFKNKTILPHERDELVATLEVEREQAEKEGDTARFIALSLLIIALPLISLKSLGNHLYFGGKDG